MATNQPQKITVLGSGVSGIESARLLLEQGFVVFLSDIAPQEKVDEVVTRAGLQETLQYEAGGHTERIYDADCFVISPGVPYDAPVLVEARKRDIPVIGELELGFVTSVASFVAVTGSTGKSTTVSMMDHLFEVAGKEHGLCGNIGDPVVAVAPKLSEEGVAICEVSSFQLETIQHFAPAIAVILNLAPNHLDRHASLEEYYGAKYRIVENMESGLVILNGADPELVRWARTLTLPEEVKICFFGTPVEGYLSATIENDLCILDGAPYASVATLSLPGEHNRQNALVVAVVAYAYGIPSSDFEKALATFRGLPHRMEKVAEKRGVTFYNDSKATTAESVEAALSGFADGTIHLIAGGKDKGAPFENMASLIKQKCVQVYAIGNARPRLQEVWGHVVTVEACNSLQEAVEKAYGNAKEGETVLLSPGCASFDMFRDFVDRGKQFTNLAQEICV